MQFLLTCCCDQPPGEYNAVSFTPTGDLRWAVRWEAVDGESFGGMSVLADSNGQQCIKVVGTTLIALGTKSGNLYAAGLDITNGQEAFPLTDTGQAFNPRNISIGNCLATTSHIVLPAMRTLASATYRVQRYAVDASCSLTFTESNDLAAGSSPVNRVTARANSTGHVTGIVTFFTSKGFQAASVNENGESGRTVAPAGVYWSPVLRTEGSTMFIYRAISSVFGAWHEAAVPFGDFSALTSDGDYGGSVVQLDGPPSVLDVTPMHVHSSESRYWVRSTFISSGATDHLRMRYLDMTTDGLARVQWSQDLASDAVPLFGTWSFDDAQTVYQAMGTSAPGTAFISAVDEAGTKYDLAAGSALSGAALPTFTPTNGLLIDSPATNTVYASHRQGFISQLLRSLSLTISGGELVKLWEWEGGMPLCATTDDEDNYFGVGNRTHLTATENLVQLLPA